MAGWNPNEPGGGSPTGIGAGTTDLIPMNEIYVHAQDGSDAAAGTAVAPKQSLSSVETFLTAYPNNSVVHLAGTFWTETFSFSNLDNVLIKQWEGQTQAVIRGDSIITGTWTASGNEFFIADLTGLVVRMWEDWDTNLDANGSNLGSLDPFGIVHEPGALEENEFDWDDGTDRFYVRLFDNEDPNDHVMTVSRSNINGPKLSGCTNITVSGISIWKFAYATDDESEPVNSGCGIQLHDCSSISIHGCDFRDNGDGQIFVTGSTQTIDLECTHCEFHGGMVQGCAIVVSLNANEDIDGITFENFTVYSHFPLDRNGDKCPGDYTVAVGNVHAKAFRFNINTSEKSDIIFRRGYVDGYSDSCLLSLMTNPAAPSDPTDISTYPIIFEDVKAINLKSIVQSNTAGVGGTAGDGASAYRRCILHCPAVTDTNPAGTSRAETEVIHCTDYPAAFDSCVITADISTTATNAVFRVQEDSNIYLKNCTVCITNSDAGASPFFYIDDVSLDERVNCVQCLFLSERALGSLAILAGGAPDLSIEANMVFDNCWFYKMAAVPTDCIAALNHANWLANIDTGAIIDVDPEVISVPSNLSGGPASKLQRRRKILATATKRGVNRQDYSGHYGSYQYKHSMGGAFVAIP